MSSKTTLASVFTWEQTVKLLFSSITYNGTVLDMQDIDLGIPLAYGDTLVFEIRKGIKCEASPHFYTVNGVCNFEGNKITLQTFDNSRLFCGVINDLVTLKIFFCGKNRIQTSTFAYVTFDHSDQDFSQLGSEYFI